MDTLGDPSSSQSGADVSNPPHPSEPHPNEPHRAGGLANRLNWLRAGVLGANDGIVSTAGIVIGVAAATVERGPIFTAGIAGLSAGAVSMALGEYVSVSTQRDTEKALLAKESQELAEQPEEEFEELVGLYQDKGLSRETATQVATELTARDAFEAHVDAELGFDPDALTNPWQAALSSAISFTVGALLPLVAILLPPATWRVPIAFLAVIVALGITGAVGATLGGSHPLRPMLRVMIGGAIAMAVTYAIGQLVGHSVA